MPNKPLRLGHPPLVEAIFEIRFEASQVFAGDLFPGLMYSELQDLFDGSEPLPAASIPKGLRLNDPNFKYSPHMRLTGANHALQLGDHVATFSERPPYEGWPKFQSLIDRVLTAMKLTRLISEVERYSLKYVNILEPDPALPLGPLNAVLTLADFEISNKGFRLRAEIESPSHISIIDLASGATI